ncbi:DUF7144 family membrane protein [Streptomyces regalis]|uniref:DUF7144 domain-containing protein n=1 Tax=Streptomyces regalis TaxID=68262 RepID=A0A0X3V6R0_9ACTN|nr:hypothetical protein [Streptomyces regalis]KUL40368.1 hypothetical protein ADL12_13240 [Streptomyces regalis]
MSQQQPQPQSHATDAAHSRPGSAGAGGSGGSAASQATWPSAGPAHAPTPAPGAGEYRPAPGWATGGLVFAGVLMLVNGLLAILQGISAIAEDDVYGRIGDYVFEINLTAWGWILLGLGVVVACVGYGILKGAWWARITGIFVASLSMVLHFLFLPYTPVWSVIMVGVDFFVILALATAPDVPRASASMRGNASAAR